MRTLLPIVLIFFSGLMQAQDDLLKKSEKGDAEAMFYLASSYFMGEKGYPQNNEKKPYSGFKSQQTKAMQSHRTRSERFT